MITGHCQEFAFICAATLQCSQQVLALVESILPEANHQVSRLEVITTDHLQRFFRSRTEFRDNPEGRSQCPEQGDRAFRCEIVETQCCQSSAASAAIRCQQMQFAAKAVTKPERCDRAAEMLFKRFSARTELLPAFPRLKLVVETWHVAPRVNRQLAGRKRLKKSPIAELRTGSQITSTNKLHQSACGCRPQAPALITALPATHAFAS